MKSSISIFISYGTRSENFFGILGGIILILLAVLLNRNKSRIVAIAIFSLSIFVFVFTILNLTKGASLLFVLIFLLASFRSIQATFLYNKIGNSSGEPKRKHSVLGKISLRIFVLILLVNIIIAILEKFGFGANGTILGNILGITVIFGSMIGGLIGVVFGIIGMCQKNYIKLLSVLGFLLNSLVFIYVNYILFIFALKN